jgi:hypothetical protein
MPTTLKVVGPVEIPAQSHGSSKHIRKQDIETFWLTPEAVAVAAKHGCFVFALRAAKGHTPWYVGQTKVGMEKECFSHRNVGIYNEVLFHGKKGTPVMFFIVPDGAKIKVPRATVDDIEQFLIQTGVQKNPGISNVKHTKNLADWCIEGVIRAGQGRRPKPSQAFVKMFGL